MANPNNLTFNVQVNGLSNLHALSAGLRNITAQMHGSVNATRAMDAQQRALNNALGLTNKGLQNHAKTISQVITNQSALSGELKKVKIDINNLGSQFSSTNSKVIQATANLKTYEKSLKSIKARALVTDLRSLSTEMKRLGKDAQFTGRSMIIGLTTPILAFGRIGLSTLVAVDTQLVRLNKVIEYIAPNIADAARKLGTDVNSMTEKQKTLAEGMVSEFNKLDASLLETSRKFGVARELILSIAGDFAELGNAAVDTTIKLTELTAEAEKLGNLDIGASRALIQSMYQQANRAISINAQMTGKLVTVQERESKALAAVNGQLAMFNAIENATALSLRDLADAFPEMAAASTSFGLSMTEAAALLAPMVASGFEVGASANSIKVSLQRLNAPTKQNMEMMKALADTMGGEFLDATHLGIDSLDYLAQAFGKLSEGGTNAEAALEFMSNLFGVRQGPRFEVAIQELDFFNKALASGNKTAEGQLASLANNSIQLSNKMAQTNVPLIKTFSDIGKIARIASAEVNKEIEVTDELTGKQKRIFVTPEDIEAARKARQAVGDEILKARREGRDIISEISTQAGRAMIVELAGAGSAAEIAKQELDAALGSLDTKIQRIKTNFKLIAAELIEGFRPVLDIIDKLINSLSTWFQNMSPITKTLISIGLVGVAALGPLVFAFGQARLAMATVMNGLLKFLPGLSNLTLESIAASPALLRLSNPLIKTGDGFTTAASRMSIFLARLASMNNPIGRVAQKIGVLTGSLKKFNTADATVTASLATTTKYSQSVTALGNLPATGLTKPSMTPNAAQMQIEAMRIAKRQGGTILSGGKTASIPGAGIVSLRSALMRNQAKQNLMRAAHYGGTTRDLNIAEDLFFKNRGLVRQGTLGARSFTSATTGISASAGLTEREIRRLVGTRMQSGLAAGVRYGTIGQGGPSASFYGGKVLSARQEMSIARGGVRGALTKVGTRLFGSEVAAAPSIKTVTGINAVKKAINSMKGAPGIFGKISAGVRSLGSSFISILPSVGSLRSGLMNMASSAKGGLFKVTGINNIKNAVSKAKSAISELSTRSAQYGQAAPGFFSKASTGMMSFGKSILSGSKMFKILRVAMMSTGILAIIMAITAGVFFLIKTFQNMGAKSAAVTKNFKAAWNSIKAAISAIIKPIKDTIGTLVIMMGNATGGAGGAGKAIENISEKIKSFAESVKNFVTKYIVPVIETVMKAVIDVIRGIVNFIKGIIEIVKGNWGKGFKLILKGLAMFARAFVGIWAALERITIKIIASIAKAIVNLFVAALNKVADLVTSLAGSIVGFGSALLGWVPGLGDGLDKISDWLHSIEKPFDSIGDIANGVIDGVADAATGVVDSIESTVKGIIENIAGKQQEIIDGAGDNLVEKGKETGRDLGEVITEPLGDALEEVIGGAGDQLKELIRDLKQKFVDLVLDSVKGALDEAVDSMKEALEKQKDAALDVFDQQLEALNKLEKAEESLTKEKEYQADRRRLIDERELQRANYIRNRALAIYEGRIDDARVLSLEEQKNSRDFNTDLAKTDEQRRQDLAKENLDALKEAIQKSKDETDKLLEEQIKAFEEAAKQITKFPPNTIQEYDQQLKELNEVATRIAGENGDILQDMMNKMKDNLKMPNENVGVFRTGLDQLVQTAIDKYGLISPTNGTIVGSTIAMLAGIEGQIVGNTGDITNAFQGIVDNVFDSSSLLDNIADEIVAPALDNITSIFESKNPFAVWIQAVKDANETILREMQKTVGHVASVVEELAGLISDAVAKLAILNEARNGGGSGGGGGGNGSTGPGTPTDGTPSPGSGGPAGGDFSTILNRNAWVTIGQKIPASIASKKMELYNIVVDSYKKYYAKSVTWQSLLDYFGSRASYATPEGKTVYDTLVSLRRVMPTQFGGAGANSTSSSSGRATGTVNAGGVQVGYDMSRGQYDQITNAVANWTPTRFFGGRISKYAAGGIVPGFMSQGIKALLHGGEYVVNANAVRNIGYATLESLNNMRYMTPSGPRGGGQTVVSDTQNVNIYVDTFIGEEQWFESMMKSYNLKIVPRNQKRAGAENRTISTYSGINRGV